MPAEKFKLGSVKASAEKSVIDPEIMKAGEKASPFIRGMCQYIITHAKTAVSDKDADQLEVDKLFKSFPNDNTTTRLSQVFELLTGIKPTLNSTACPFELLDIAINSTDKKPYVIVYNSSGSSYGVNATGDGYFAFACNGNNPKANISEVGEFAKQLLTTSGYKFINYCNTSLHQTVGSKLLEVLKLTDLL